MIMRKFYFYILMLMPMFALTSCDTDEMIAITLHGTWRGTMYENYYDRYGDYWGNGASAYYTVISFDKRGHTSGTGVEYDEDDYGNVIERSFDWKVDLTDIYLYYSDYYYYNGHRYTDRNYEAIIYNATLDDYYFTGYIEDNAGNRRHFELEYYGDYYDRYSYSRTRSADDETFEPTLENINKHKINTKKEASR